MDLVLVVEATDRPNHCFCTPHAAAMCDVHTMPDARIDTAKQKMLDDQLRYRGIEDARVLAAMAKVPRERFIARRQRRQAYSDRALPIDCGQTISQPYIVALMTEALRLSGDEVVLEVGTGSGYQTAVLAEVAREVVTIERIEVLACSAAEALAELGYRNVRFETGDGTAGLADAAPFDRIIVTAAAPRCPPSLFEQLAEDGILVIPLGGRDCQQLQAIRKVDGRAMAIDLSACRFVPLIGGGGWPA